MNKLTFSVLLGLSTALLLIFFVLPAFQDIPVQTEKKSKLEALLIKFEEIRKKKEEIGSNYAAISEADVARLDRLVPTSPEIGQLLVNLDLLVRQDHLKMTGIQFQKVGKDTTGAPQNAADAAVVASFVPYGKLPLTLSLTGSYENFRQFMIDIENVIRLTDVVRITFGGGGGGEFTYTVQAETYFIEQP